MKPGSARVRPMPPSMRPYEPLRSMRVMWSRDGVLICMGRPFLFCLCCVVWEVMKVAGVFRVVNSNSYSTLFKCLVLILC